MKSFTFGKKKTELVFPNKTYILEVDGLLKTKADKVSDWAIEQSKRLFGIDDDTIVYSVISETLEGVCEKIDYLLDETGASKEILGERLSGDVAVAHFDACDVMNFILREIQSTWKEVTSERLKAAKKAKGSK